MFKLKIHSAVDLITNSSTVIYTISEGCVKPVKELVNEMLKVMNNDHLTFDDLFYADVFLDDLSDYYEYNDSDFPEIDSELTNREYTEMIFDKVIKGEIDKPKWMLDVENNYENNLSTYLYLVPKDEAYKELANKLINFLYSTDHEEGYN